MQQTNQQLTITTFSSLISSLPCNEVSFFFFTKVHLHLAALPSWCFTVYCCPYSSSSSPCPLMGTQTAAIIYSQRSSPDERPWNLAHSLPLPQAMLGNVCNGFHPNLGHSIPPRLQQQVSRGRLRWAGFAWQQPAGPPSRFHQARTAARG